MIYEDDVKPLDGLEPQIGLLGASLLDSTREWREYLTDLPDEAVWWQPYHNGYSIGAVILHMISCERYWIERICLSQEIPPGDVAVDFDSTIDQENGFWPEPPQHPLKWYLELQDQSRERILESLKELPDPTLEIVRRENKMTVRWILAHVVEHDSYHGGQIVMLQELWKANAEKSS